MVNADKKLFEFALALNTPPVTRVPEPPTLPFESTMGDAQSDADTTAVRVVVPEGVPTIEPFS
jgi:hypothetical protein